MNQTLETYLRIFCGHQQDDWAMWLPIAQYALNARPSHTTKVSPFEMLIGVIPRGLNDPAIKESGWDRLTDLKNTRDKAHEAILQWLKKLSQCLAILKRLTCHKSNQID